VCLNLGRIKENLRSDLEEYEDAPFYDCLDKELGDLEKIIAYMEKLKNGYCTDADRQVSVLWSERDKLRELEKTIFENAADVEKSVFEDLNSDLDSLEVRDAKCVSYYAQQLQDYVAILFGFLRHNPLLMKKFGTHLRRRSRLIEYATESLTVQHDKIEFWEQYFLIQEKISLFQANFNKRAKSEEGLVYQKNRASYLESDPDSGNEDLGQEAVQNSEDTWQ